MRHVLLAAAVLGLSLVPATAALAQAVNNQASTVAGALAAAPAQQQQAVTLPGALLFSTRRAGIGAGGFLQLCDDPLDPRLIIRWTPD
jgi:hypothetical protein